MFLYLNEDELATNWHMWRDEERKVHNVLREFGNSVYLVENKLEGKWTLRAGGQIMRSKQLSIIREICYKLELITLHGSHMKKLNGELLEIALDMV